MSILQDEQDALQAIKLQLKENKLANNQCHPSRVHELQMVYPSR
jgi:hypothetical protein